MASMSMNDDRELQLLASGQLVLTTAYIKANGAQQPLQTMATAARALLRQLIKLHPHCAPMKARPADATAPARCQHPTSSSSFQALPLPFLQRPLSSIP
ncbi:unnamed protein product [Nippostrongylus brasiliensis]|uniref:Uncharacterized protein n=1 Tax=Nippostrongylus brasiliensis TaxID=27835 RepID=A0A0N4XZK2_NIPBR|nr:unnamed protein product [Nippostrongylus brasiliensis]